MLLLSHLSLLTFILVQQVTADGPSKFAYEEEVNRWQHRHLINMTGMLCKDAMYKLRQADYVQTGYKHTIGYELGILACGIMEKFKHMIRIYRYYSNPKMFKDHKHRIEALLNAYSVLQSDYSELIAEIVLYYEVLVDHRAQQAARVLRARVYAKKHRMTLQAVLQLMDKGIDLEKMTPPHLRRSMLTNSSGYDEAEEYDLLEDRNMAGNKTEGPSTVQEESSNVQKESKKSVKNIFAKNNVSREEAAYKKKLRYIMWAEKWDGYDPATEGVHIDDTIAKLGLNDSDYLLKELRGDV